MPEVLGSPPSPRTVLFWNGTEWQWALVDAAGHLQIDVVDAAGLQDALQSVATDRLQVRGANQLFSFREVLGYDLTAVISGADGYIVSAAVPADQIWIVTTFVALDATSPCTQIRAYTRRAGALYEWHNEEKAFAAGDRTVWGGHTYLETDDVIRVYFTGAQAGDSCSMYLTGYSMTPE